MKILILSSHYHTTRATMNFSSIRFPRIFFDIKEFRKMEDTSARRALYPVTSKMKIFS